MPRTTEERSPRRFIRLDNAKDVVEVLGGFEAVSDLTGAAIKSLYHWTGATKAFPARFHDTMIKALKRRGYTAPASLWNQTPAKAKKAA